MDESVSEQKNGSPTKQINVLSQGTPPIITRGRAVENGKRVIRYYVITKERVAINLARVLGRTTFFCAIGAN